MKSVSPFDNVKLPILMALVCAVSLIIGMRLQESLTHDGYLSKPISSDAQRAIYEASEHIKHKYYGELSEDTFTDAVIRTMVDELDPFSHYFEADKSIRYDRYINGLYRGIGLEFVPYRDTVYVYNVLPGSPAEEGGISRGDVLVGLDTLRLSNSPYNLDSLIKTTSKQLGDTTILQIKERLNNNVKRIELVVSEVSVPLIEDYIIKAEEDSILVGLVRINRFYSEVYRDFMEVLERQRKDGYDISHLILDLRDNPGGIVEETVKMLNQFIKEGKQLLLSTVTRTGKVKEYMSNGRNFLDLERIVILVDDESASASEILAGVLQDYDIAVIMGQNTFGKGLIQQNYDLSNEGSINLSIGEYILPSGRHINPSSAKDSSYISLTNQRELRSDKGIPVDITIESCDEKVTSIDLRDFVIEHQLWTTASIDQSIRDLLANVLQETDDAAGCIEFRASRLLWEAIKSNTLYGEEVSMADLDHTIKEAYDLIKSDEYLDILGY